MDGGGISVDISECEACTEDCPQAQGRHEAATGRMYAMRDLAKCAPYWASLFDESDKPKITPDRLRELVEADRAGRCVVLPVLPALRPGSRGSEIFILLDSGEIAEDDVHDISIGLNSRGEMNVVFSTFDSGDFETADVGKRIFWDIKSAQQAASSLKGEPPC